MLKPSKYIKYGLSVLLAGYLLVARPTHTSAVSTPAFPACPNPAGEVIASYSDGIHGIVGDSGVYTGSDTVTKVNSNQVIQCFCPKSGNEGIQTLWWKYSDLSESDLSVLLKQGWVWIPNGALWGLDPEAYLAKNSHFSCGGTGGGSNGGSSSSSSSTSSSGGIGGAVLGISTLANTGNQNLWLVFLCLALSFSYSANLLTRELR